MFRGIQIESLMEFYEIRRKRTEKLLSINGKAVKERIEAALIKNGFAQNGQCLTYAKDLMQPLGLDHHFSRDRDHIGRICGEISSETLLDPQCGAMLSAVVVNKTGKNKGRPSDIFFPFAETLTGLKFRNDQEREEFWKQQIALLQKYIASIS